MLILLIFGGVGLCAQLPWYTLEPPTNLEVEAVECDAYLTWDKPVISNPPGLIGYRIYRDGAYLAYVSGQDTTWYYDFTVMPGDRTYSVSAYYDLTEYDYPGFFDESVPAGPEEIIIICSGCLPFCEHWDQASFAYTEWSFYPSQGNWTITTLEGFPAPAATYTGTPADTNYTNILCLYSHLINAGPFTCAVIHFDYDIRLDDVSTTGAENMAAEVYYKDMWHLMDLFSNTGSFGWEHVHHEIPDAGGGIMKIRFRAFGDNSADIANWYLDNICITPYCNPPVSPTGDFNGQDVLLSWHPPICNQGFPQSWIQEEIAYHDGNPATASLQSFDWVYGTVFDLSGFQYALLYEIDFHHAVWGYPCNWKYRIHVVDWSTYMEVATIGPFFTSEDGGWEEDISLDSISGLGGGMVGIFLQPMGLAPDNAYPRLSSDNSGPQGGSLYGSFPDYLALTPSTTGDYLINLRILIPDTVNKGPALIFSPGSITQEVYGYNVYRSSDVGTAFTLLTPEPVTDTSYLDTDPPLSSPVLYYYIIALFDNAYCESIPSDTVEVLMTGIDDLQGFRVEVYPNPASGVIHVSSDVPLKTIELMTSFGKTVRLREEEGRQNSPINVSDLSSGIYLVKATTALGVVMKKIAVVR
ncbi:MAG: T9SS type A sorting domain-containing protein [bacterium]